MKKIFLSCFFCIVSILNIYAQWIDGKTILYNYAPSGLRMRNEPNGKDIITTIPYGGTMIYLENNFEIAVENTEVDGIESGWQKIKYQDKTGYVFAGYLSRLPIPKQSENDIFSYLKHNFEQAGKNYTWTNGGIDNDNYSSDSAHFFVKGIITVMHHQVEYYEGYEELAIFNNVRYEEVYLLVKTIFKSQIDNAFDYYQKNDTNPDDEKLKAFKKLVRINGKWEIELTTEGCYDGLSIRDFEGVIIVSKAGGC